jgi:hypothetical protein
MSCGVPKTFSLDLSGILSFQFESDNFEIESEAAAGKTGFYKRIVSIIFQI